MASLKEIKARIASVENTRKITSARQMISSAYLHRSQQQLSNIRDYKEELDKLVDDFFEPATDDNHPDDKTSLSGEIAIIILSSNTGMCGSFNANIIKKLHELPAVYPGEELIYYPIGSKIRDALRKEGYTFDKYGIENLDFLSAKFILEDARQTAARFIELYQCGKVKQIDIVYHHYLTTSRQEIKIEKFLPYPYVLKEEAEDDLYIIEPSIKELGNEIMNLSINATLFNTLINNQTSEHATRLIAMQLATENADDLLTELHLTYNKLRQQSITSELLDIVSNSFG